MPTPTREQRRLHAIAARFGFDDQERHDLAMLVVGYEGSWATIPDDLAERLATGLLCVAAVNWLLLERTRHLREQIAAPPPPNPIRCERRTVSA